MLIEQRKDLGFQEWKSDIEERCSAWVDSADFRIGRATVMSTEDVTPLYPSPVIRITWRCENGSLLFPCDYPATMEQGSDLRKVWVDILKLPTNPERYEMTDMVGKTAQEVVYVRRKCPIFKFKRGRPRRAKAETIDPTQQQ